MIKILLIPGFGPVSWRHPLRIKMTDEPIPLTGLAHCSYMTIQSELTLARDHWNILTYEKKALNFWVIDSLICNFTQKIANKNRNQQ